MKTALSNYKMLDRLQSNYCGIFFNRLESSMQTVKSSVGTQFRISQKTDTQTHEGKAERSNVGRELSCSYKKLSRSFSFMIAEFS